MMKNILEYLEQTAPRYPDKTAFANDTMSMTFSEVASAARRIGSVLAQKQYASEPVVIYMKRHPHMITAFLGVVYSGCYYVPIDEEMPRFRIDLILETLKPRVILCEEQTREEINEFAFSGELLVYEELIQAAPDEDLLHQIRRRQIDTDPIYIVFTSGSTGIPKGVIACHRSVIDYADHLLDVLKVSDESVFANQTPLYFDACLKEIMGTLKCGATTYLVPKQLFRFPKKLVQFLNQYKINTVCWVVSALTMISALNTFKSEVPQYLHTIAFGSEVFPIKQFNLWRKTLPNARFINLYGPTEATGMSCYYEVNREFAETDVIPVGQPFENTEILLLDEHDRPAKDGEPGEICIRGTALTLGYYNNPEKTSEAFVQNPLQSHYPELIYRTGDIGKINEYGELVFLSRKDFQIKHMGHRIELGEIEARVNMIDQIQSACCVYNKEKQKIILYYTGDVSEKDLLADLKTLLPRYMVPNKVVPLAEMPLTENGKINRKMLASRPV
ncbi:MAG: amino acid adenylation domain-containing protein [Eubacterium sp.]|nr:amino acid adenylation domain-containing protein [Eubacterium sp.]